MPYRRIRRGTVPYPILTRNICRHSFCTECGPVVLSFLVFSVVGSRWFFGVRFFFFVSVFVNYCLVRRSDNNARVFVTERLQNESSIRDDAKMRTKRGAPFGDDFVRLAYDTRGFWLIKDGEIITIFWTTDNIVYSYR